MLRRVIGGLLAMNAGLAVRAIRHGPRDAAGRLRRVSWLTDPLGPAGLPGPPARPDLGLPESPLSSFLSGPAPLVSVDPLYTYEDGSLPVPDLLALLAIVADRRPAAILEVGTYCGHTTRLLARNFPDATVHTVDLPEDAGGAGGPLPRDDFHLIANRRVGAAYRADPLCGNVVQHFGDTAGWDFGRAEGAGVVFIDGSHTYEYARNDTERAMGSLGRPLTLIWHDVDADHPGVTRWLREMVEGGHPVRKVAGTNLAAMDVG